MVSFCGVKAYAKPSFHSGAMVIDDYAQEGTLKSRVDTLLGGSSSTLYQSVTSLVLAGSSGLNEADWKFFRDNLSRVHVFDLGETGTTRIAYVKENGALPWVGANSSLETIVLPSTVEELGKGAFFNCVKLSQINFSNDENNVETLLERSLSNCNSLTTIDFPNVSRVVSGGSGCFVGSTAISTFHLGKVETVPDKVFSTLRSTAYGRLQFVSMPQLLEVPDGALSYQGGLKAVDFSSAEKIGARAFKGCPSLETATFPSAKMLGEEAFASCSNLGVADFPHLEKAGDSAFYFSGVQLKRGESSFPRLAAASNNMFVGCKRIQEAYFPKLLTVGTAAFRGCSNLQESSNGVGTRRLSFPDLRTIEAYAFAETGSSIYHFPEVTSIGNNAFNACMSLQSVSLPKLSGALSAGAFNGCSNMRVLVLGKLVRCESNFESGSADVMVTFYSDPGTPEEFESFRREFQTVFWTDRSATRKMVKYNENYLLNDADYDIRKEILTQEVGSYLYLENMSPITDTQETFNENKDAFVKRSYLPMQAIGSSLETSARWGWHRETDDVSAHSKPFYEKDPLDRGDEGKYSVYIDFYFQSSEARGSFVRAEFPAVQLKLTDPTPPAPHDRGPHGGYVTSTTKCEVCHSAHRAKGNLDGTNNYIQRAGGKVCMSCHTALGGGGSALLIEWPVSGEGPHGNSWCTDCHQGSIHGDQGSKFAVMNTYMLGSQVDDAITQGFAQGNINENLIYDPSDTTTKNGAYWFQNGGSLLSPQGDPPMNVSATQFAAARATATGYLCNQSGCHGTIGPTAVVNTSGFSSDYGLTEGKLITGHGTGAFEQSATDPSCAPCHPGGLAGGYRHDENYLTNQKAATYGCDQCHDMVGVASNTTAWPHASKGIKVYEWDKTGHKESVTPTYEKNLWMYTYDVGVPYQTSAFSSQTGQNGDGKANVADNWNREFRVVSDARDENGALIHGRDALCLKCHVPVDAASKEARGAGASTPLNPGTRYSHHYQVNALGNLDVDDPSQYSWDVEGSAPGAGYKGSKLIFLFR